MSLVDTIDKAFRLLLPSPFSIAILLTFLAFSIALVFAGSPETPHLAQVVELLGYWQKGLWDPPLLVFAMQMMLMLVLGHVVALSPPAAKVIDQLTSLTKDTATTAASVAFFTMCVSLFNWGLGLIFGAVMARKIAEKAIQENRAIHYPLIGAAAYLGMLVFHSGLSASAPLKANEAGHIADLMGNATLAYEIPERVGLDATIFSQMNILAVVSILVIIPSLLYFLGKKIRPKPIRLSKAFKEVDIPGKKQGAEQLDYSGWFGRIPGMLMLGYAIYLIFAREQGSGLNFITPDYINTILFGLCLTLHANVFRFTRALNTAISDISGIIIQYPLYFGIMGIMRSSGLVQLMADSFAQISTAETFPIFTFISAAIINVFVPSGGGQWTLQAPILIETSQQLGVPLSKSIMALAYGDQLTNMTQPLWALPLLGITGLKAREILPFTLLFMLAAMVIFLLMLALF